MGSNNIQNLEYCVLYINDDKKIQKKDTIAR